MAGVITIEPTESKDTGVCSCCGRASRRVWGYVYVDDNAYAVYCVHRTVGHVPEMGANVDLIIGDWGTDATPEDRVGIAQYFRQTETGNGFMVIDATDRDHFADREVVGNALLRDEVVGTYAAEAAFAVGDAVLLQDIRVAELLGRPVTT